MEGVRERFNTMLNFCYMIHFTNDVREQKKILQEMSEYVRGDHNFNGVVAEKVNAKT